MKAQRPPSHPGRAPLRFGVRGHEHLDPAHDDLLHLRLVPGAGVRHHHFRRLDDPGRLELTLGRGDHRPEVPEVRRVDRHFGGNHDLALVGRRLGVVALHPPARRLEVARVRIGDVDLARRRLGRLIGLRRAAEPAPVLHHPARAVGLVSLVRAAVHVVVFFEPTLALVQPPWARPRNRPGFGGALLVEAALRFAQPAAPPLLRR